MPNRGLAYVATVTQPCGGRRQLQLMVLNALHQVVWSAAHAQHAPPA